MQTLEDAFNKYFIPILVGTPVGMIVGYGFAHLLFWP